MARHEISVTFLVDDANVETLEQLRFTLIDQLVALAYEHQPMLFTEDGEESAAEVVAVRGSWETAAWPPA